MMHKINWEWIIASPATMTVWDFYFSQADAAAKLPEIQSGCMADITKFEGFHAEYGYGDHDPEYWLKQASKAKLQAEDYRVMTYDEYAQQEADSILSRPITEITEEKYNEMLEVLPPMKWGVNRGVNSFFMSEFWSGNYTQQYAHIGTRFFCKLVDYRKPETWIQHSMISITV